MDSVKFEWVIARYTSNNEAGLYALSLANAGQSYVHLNKDRKKTDDIIVAFKRALDYSQPFPAHLEKASDFQVKKLDQIDRKRMGVDKH